MALSYIKDQRKPLQIPHTESRGRTKPNQAYHNLRRSNPPGELTPPLRNQRLFLHKKTQMINRSQRERQNESKQFQNHLEKTKSNFHKRLIPYSSSGQLVSKQFQRDPFQRRGGMIHMLSQNQTNISHGGRQKSRVRFQNQHETMNFPIQLRPFNSSDQLSNKHLLRAISKMKSRFNISQFHKQKIFLRAGGGEGEWSKLLFLPTNPQPKQDLEQGRRTKSRSTTLWTQWIPPYSVTDEYYDSDENKTVTDSREKHGWVGGDGWDFMQFYHPNDPKYGLDPNSSFPP